MQRSWYIAIDHLIHLLPVTYLVQAQLYGPYRTMQGPLDFTQVQVLLFFSNRILLHQFQTSTVQYKKARKLKSMYPEVDKQFFGLNTMIFLLKNATAFIISRKIKVAYTHTFFFSSFRDCTPPPAIDQSAKSVSSYWNRATLKQHRTPFTGKFLPRFQGTLQKSKTHAFLNLKAQVSWPLRKPDKHPCNLGLTCTSKAKPQIHD